MAAQFITDLPPIEFLLKSRDSWCARYVQLAEYITKALPEDTDEAREQKADFTAKFEELKKTAARETNAIGIGLAALDITADAMLKVIEDELKSDGSSTEELFARLLAQAEKHLGLGKKADKADKPADPLDGKDVLIPEDAFKDAS